MQEAYAHRRLGVTNHNFVATLGALSEPHAYQLFTPHMSLSNVQVFSSFLISAVSAAA